MNRFASLLLPLDGSLEAAKGIHCALWLSEALHATLHVLHASSQTDQGALLREQLGLPVPQAEGLVLHEACGPPDAAMLAAIEEYGIDLVVMTSRGESASSGHNPSQRLGGTAQTVLERTPVPVLLLPLHYREVLPWKSILVAASGEVVADQALETATHLAAALKLGITVVHVGNDPAGRSAHALGGYSDSLHHEYAHRMEDMVERGLASCTHSERRCVHQTLLRAGDPAQVLMQEIRARKSDVLALGYHGAFGEGHALVLKFLLENVHCPLLLLRGSESGKTLLKVGEEFDR